MLARRTAHGFMFCCRPAQFVLVMDCCLLRTGEQQADDGGGEEEEEEEEDEEREPASELPYIQSTVHSRAEREKRAFMTSRQTVVHPVCIGCML